MPHRPPSSRRSDPRHDTWPTTRELISQIRARPLVTIHGVVDITIFGVRQHGFDEISVRKGQRYLTVVVDHHTGRLVWAHAGRDRKTVEKFLDLLGKDRCEKIELVSCDDAEWITRPVAERCPNATICLDPFVRHEALPVRSGCETPTPGCRGSPVKLRAV